MTKQKSTTTAIHKLRIGAKLDLNEVEEAFGAATRKSSLAKGVTANATELARVDIMKNETIVFLRGDKGVADNLTAVLKKKSPKAKFRIAKATVATLAKAP